MQFGPPVAIPRCCGVGWQAAAPIQPLAWEVPYVVSVALKRKKKKKKKKALNYGMPLEK